MHARNSVFVIRYSVHTSYGLTWLTGFIEELEFLVPERWNKPCSASLLLTLNERVILSRAWIHSLSVVFVSRWFTLLLCIHWGSLLRLSWVIFRIGQSCGCAKVALPWSFHGYTDWIFFFSPLLEMFRLRNYPQTHQLPFAQYVFTNPQFQIQFSRASPLHSSNGTYTK